MNWTKIILPVILALNVQLTGCYKSEKADLIIHNAKIYTVNGTFDIAEAMAVKDGKIVAVGAERAILNKYGAEEIIDAKKKPVYPGFIDGHCHFLGYGLTLKRVNLVGTSSFSEVVDRVKNFALEEDSEWITGRGWDQNDWATNAFPDNQLLDSLFPHTPILLKRIDGHAALANSEALKRAGISMATEIEGGIVEKKNGRLTGILIDNAIELVQKVIPPPADEQKSEALIAAQENCFAVGITTVDDAGLDRSEIELIDRLQKEGALKMKVYAMISDNKANLDHYLIAGPYKTERLNVRSFKFYADGALGSRGACLIHPYADVADSTHHGMLMSDPEHYREYAEKLYTMGFQMNTHCIGDSANRFILDVYKNVLKGTNDKRWRIEHAQVIHPDDFRAFGELNVIPSVQPTHATSDMYWAEKRIGERVKYAYAYKRLMKENGLLALGTDFPVEKINPLNTFYAAVARTDEKGFPDGGFQSENSLSRKEALMGMTIWNAIANFEEAEKGSLEPGKDADFVILDKDIMVTDQKEILSTQVKGTFIFGEKVFWDGKR